MAPRNMPLLTEYTNYFITDDEKNYQQLITKTYHKTDSYPVQT